MDRTESEERWLGPFATNLMNTPVEELYLYNTRVKTCLLNEGAKFLGDVVQMTEQELLRAPNFGRHSLNVLKEFLATKGLHLGMTTVQKMPEYDARQEEVAARPELVRVICPHGDFIIRQSGGKLHIEAIGGALLIEPNTSAEVFLSVK